jgi:hypothetical protein
MDNVRKQPQVFLLLCFLIFTGKCEYSAYTYSNVSIVSVNLGPVSSKGEIRRTLVTIPINKETTLVVDNFYIEPEDTVLHEYDHVLHCSGDFSLLKGGNLKPASGKNVFWFCKKIFNVQGLNVEIFAKFP